MNTSASSTASIEAIKTLAIGEFCETGSGGTPDRSKYKEFYEGGDIPWIKSGELNKDVIMHAEERITREGLEKSSAKLLKPGGILLAMYGATVGKVSKLGIHAATNQAVCHIYPDANMCTPDYLYFALQASKETLLRSRVGVGQPNISQAIIRELRIRLPPLSEQRRITQMLYVVSKLRAQRSETCAQLDVLLQSTFLAMFGDPVENSFEWKVVRLGEHASKVGSGATPKGGDESYKKEGTALIRSMNVRDGEFRWNDLARIDEAQALRLANVVVGEDDVLLNITGASVARVCRAPKAVLPARVNQHVCIIRTDDKIDPIYLEHLLLSPSMKKRLLGIGESGATRQAITKAQVLSLLIPCPPAGKQKKFVSVVKSIEALKGSMKSQLKEFDALFESFQSAAFRGEL